MNMFIFTGFAGAAPAGADGIICARVRRRRGSDEKAPEAMSRLIRRHFWYARRLTMFECDMDMYLVLSS